MKSIKKKMPWKFYYPLSFFLNRLQHFFILILDQVGEDFHLRLH